MKDILKEKILFIIIIICMILMEFNISEHIEYAEKQVLNLENKIEILELELNDVKDKTNKLENKIANFESNDKKEEITEKEENPDVNDKKKLTSLGEFKLTAYCSCKKCCGKWALNRPKDENGNEIVYGAAGIRLKQGVSIAVDPKVIPYGSEVVIDGQIYIAHDTGGGIKGNRIDVYYNSHKEALKFKVRNEEVFLVTN